jgi:hypothetical protein
MPHPSTAPRSWLPLFASLAALGASCTVAYVGTWTPPRAVVVAGQPPPSPAEPVPAPPYAGAVWIQGHYDWSAEGWVWLPGSYVRPRAGHRWVAPRYERDAERVRYTPGHWMPVETGAAAAVPAGSPPPAPLVVPGQAAPPQPAPTPVPVPPAPPPPTVVP